MIEPEHASRVGVSQRFIVGNKEAVERARSRLRDLGIRHLRVPIEPRMLVDPAGEQWCLWLLNQLSAELDVLPSMTVDGSGVGSAAFGRLLAGLGGIVESVEICGDDAMLAGAGAAIQRAGFGAVLRVAAHGGAARLDALGSAGVLTHFDAIGVHGALGSDVAGWDVILGGMAEAARAHDAALAVWIMAGSLAPQYDGGSQAQAFFDAVCSPAERVYWSSLADIAGMAGQSGLDDATGQPKLLGRLMHGGIAEVERVLATVRRMKSPAAIGTRPVLVTGGAGFIGANLADRLASDGHHVLIYDALARTGVERNLHWLARRHPGRVSFVLGDLRDEAALSEAAAGAEAVFHLAGQVAVTTSMVHPMADFEVNARGTVALLEALRQRNPAAPLVFASTNKVYGDLADIALVRDGDCYLPQQPGLRIRGVDEARPLCFHTPYGCSKGTADQYVLDYAHSFGLRTAVLRMSCIYGERQLGTEDQGWVAHFLLKAIAGQQLTIYGDGRQVRDVLHVGDAVAAYIAAWSKIDQVSGRAFNLGGGPANAISLLQLVAHIEDLLGRRVDLEFSDWRPGDQRYFVADTQTVQRDLGLAPALGWRAGVARLAEHFGALTTPAEAAAR